MTKLKEPMHTTEDTIFSYETGRYQKAPNKITEQNIFSFVPQDGPEFRFVREGIEAGKLPARLLIDVFTVIFGEKVNKWLTDKKETERLLDKMNKDALKVVKDNGLDNLSVLVCYRGSVAHNMYTPSSEPNSIDDIDLLSIAVPPIDHYFGLKKYGSRGTREIKYGQWDIVVYEAKKMFSLLAKGNPNVLSTLWLNENHYLSCTEAGKILLENRDAFVGKHVYRPFSGYAYSQLKKMESFSFNGYMGEKRKRLVKKFGYDAKNAAHLIRLLKMAKEFLTLGRMIVFREDADELLSIKKGEWELNDIKSYSKKLFSECDIALSKSDLPEKPDFDRINELCALTVQSQLLGG